MVLCQPRIQITRTTSLRRVSNAKAPQYHCCVPKEIVFVSTTAVSTDKPNASGLTPDQTRALPERSVDPDSPEARISRSLRELYSGKAQNVRLWRPPSFSTLRLSPGFTQRSYEIYIQDAVFHGPIGIARGIDSIRAQFDALPKVLCNTHMTTPRVELIYALSPLLALLPLRNTKAPRVGEPAWNGSKPTPYRSGRRIFPRCQGRLALQG
jgi:hypothetical protein